MAKVSSPTIHFVIKSSRVDRCGASPVILIVRFNGRAERATGVKINQNQWDEKRECVRRSHPQHLALNARLSSIRSTVEGAAASLMASGKKVTAASVASAMDGSTESVGFSVSDAYEKYINEHPLRSGTVTAYRQSLRSLTSVCGDVALSAFDEALFNRWLSSLRSASLTNLTKSQYLRCASAALSHAVAVLGLDLDFSFVVSALKRTPRSVTLRREVVSAGNMRRLMRWVASYPDSVITARSTPVGRCAVFCASYVLSGLAPVDMALLTMSDLDMSDPSCLSVAGNRRKTGRRFLFTIPLTDEVSGVLGPFLRSACRRGGYVFPILRGGEMADVDVSSEGAVSLAVKRYRNSFTPIMAKAIGMFRSSRFYDKNEPLPDKVPMYSARHSFATNSTDAGCSLLSLSTAMGRSVNTLGTYIHELTSKSRMLEESSKLFGMSAAG